MKALYAVYVLVLIGLLVPIGYFVKGNHDLNEKASSCLRMQMPEQDKCFSDLGREAASLGKAAKATTGLN